ncbi:DUF3786 domain-containing protein [Acetobacterium woodii]|uniref:DUF3786 domain-containing protein n=1 Tax=Acetobacterium woodii (strain ATCC 29683 / DSM 1030 / JCM 2381 / KCTC 1655 / WB1) TaxID=931626 RepID=H6LD16_ACEWD|nr:DUF3786 domain-containing protein [Acetobacterium woodii]AFA47855.1 hypothetical protein Awo_c10690 [Acetobacterium woodii DSM 1030]
MENTLRDETAIEEKRKDKIPYEHYKGLLKNYDAETISQNSTCPFNAETSSFVVTVMGTDYRVAYPQGDVTDMAGEDFDNYKLKTMILRYLINAKGVKTTGENIAYRDVSGGNVYFACFEGRCLKRFAFTFNYNIEGLKKAMTILNAEPQKPGDLSWRFEVINNMFMTVILWLGDDEFPPEAQILFDANFPSAFSAEDMAVMGDIFIPALKELSKK